MRLHEHHREIAGVLALYGIRPDIEPTNGGHVRFKWKVGPHEQSLLTSKTPSDWRTQKNAVARVRRMLAKAGVTKIAPCASVLDGPVKRRIAPSSPAQIEARLAQLEREVQTLMDIITDPFGRRPPDKVADAPPPKAAPKKRGPRVEGWIFRAMRYDEFLDVHAIAKAASRPVRLVAVSLTYWKAKGYVEHKRGTGWRKRPNVEKLDCAPVNGHANGNGIHGSAAH